MAVYLKKNELDAYLNDTTVNIFDKSTRPFQLKQLAQDLIKRENIMLSQKFGAGTTREGLKARLQDLKQIAPNLSLLNGSALLPVVQNYEIANNIGTMRDQAAFQQMLQDEWAKWRPDEVKDPAGDLETFILYLLDKSLKEHPTLTIGEGKKTTHSGRISALTSLRISDDPSKPSKNLNTLFLNDLAKVTQARLRTYLKDHGYDAKKQNSSARLKIDKTDSSLAIDDAFDWNYYSNGYKASDVPYSKTEIESRNKEFTLEFIQRFDPLRQIPALPAILEYMFKEHPKMLYVGSSSQSITGLMGEIQALCYLSLLMGDNFSIGNSLQDVKWAAKTLYNGKQAHDDIILGHYGIQVKNSVKEIIDKVDFVDSRFDTFLDNLVKQNLIDDNLKESIMTIYEAYQYNIPYKIKYDNKSAANMVAYPVDVNKKFMATRERIVRLHSLLEAIINRMVGQLMYIGTGNAVKNNPSNIVFFVGGELLFASDIVEEILDNIDKAEQSLMVDVKFKTSYTIVNTLNEIQRKSIYNFNNHMFNAAAAEKMVRDNIFIKSSYNFASLLGKYN